MLKFQPGRTYTARSIGDHDCVFKFTVVARTAHMVTLRSDRGDKARKVRIWDGVECLDPLGRYSMSPVLRADRFE